MSRNTGKLKPYAFSFADSWSRQSNAFERSVSKAPKTLPLSTDLFHVSNITRGQCWVLYPFRIPHCWFEKMLSKNVDIWENIHFSKFFDNIGRILIGLKFSFISFRPFLCTGVTSANFKEERKPKDLIALFVLVHKNSANTSVFSLIILVGILIFCEALVLSNLRISFPTSPMFTFSKWNVLLLLYFWIARMLGWFLSFKMALKTGFLMFSITELFELNFGILSFFTILERKSFEISAVSDSDAHIWIWSFSKFSLPS